MILPYDHQQKDSIVTYGKKLKGLSLREACGTEILKHGYSGKGSFGQLLEKFYFLYEPNSDSEPDFPVAKLELKSSPLKILRTKQYRSKERLVLNIINYQDIINQEFYESSFWKKNSCLLVIFYLHEVDVDVIDYLIKIVDEWSFPAIDLEIIKNDWRIIKNKIAAGKAHELSEGDTFYLGACTKGAKGGNLRKQPNSSELAKQRAFSLKQGYVNHIIASLAGKEESATYGRLISTPEEARVISIEDRVKERFAGLLGMTDIELVDYLNINVSPSDKGYYAKITKEIINTVFKVPKGRVVEDYIEEFRKAEIIIRTVRLDEKLMPAEDISFPTFKYVEIVNEIWDESEIKSLLEHKFLFVFFKLEEGKLVLDKVKFWNMPHEDIENVELVWQKTKDIVSSGSIVKTTFVNKSGKEIRRTRFPGKKFSHVAHVRPHAQKPSDVYPLPIQDTFTKLFEYTKHCFWLNKGYVKKEIYLK